MSSPELAMRPTATENAKNTPLLSVEDLRVYFGSKRGLVHAVDGVSFDIDQGETLGLVGETGCGKSVTARSILRLVPMPPGVQAGGQILFRPRQACPSCSGTGCDSCDHKGRTAIPCRHCNGAGCDPCRQSGLDTIDLLTVSGRELRSIRGNRIAMIFQDPGKALNPSMSVRDQIAEVYAEHRVHEILERAGLSGSAGLLLSRAARRRAGFAERRLLSLPPLRGRRARVEAAIDDMIATALADTHIASPRKIMSSYPHELSGGMKQRVMIAQALACDPDLLIADEPTTALDVTIQARILELIAELQRRHNAAVLYISHDLSLVQLIANRVAVMYAGRVAESGPAGQLFNNPLHPYTRGLLHAIPSPGQRRGELAAIEGNVPELIEPDPECRFNTRCPHAAEACKRLDPPLLVRQEPDHRAACFLYDDPAKVGARPDEMPTEQT